MVSKIFDLVIIGGGVNGVAIARDAAGRGLKVLLAEQHDLASHTSSASTKLIHGGLRYLELFEFRLVREALMEREIILTIAPHITWPLRFVLPHESRIRPAWFVRLGLFFYDNLARRKKLPGTKTINLRTHKIGRDLRDDLKVAFLYSDGWVEDSRLVALTALDAAEHGASIKTRTTVTQARRSANGWEVSLAGADGESSTVTAKALVNAAGPWVADVLGRQLGINSTKHVRLVKGSHIVVRALYEGDHAFIFQNEDKRIVFAIPYEGQYTLIGTTDIPYEGDPATLKANDNEISYLCGAVNDYFKSKITPQSVVWTYSGVRPLFDDGQSSASQVSRDYVLDLEASGDQAPVLSVFGGKITTHRELAVHAMAELRPFFPGMGGEWTHASPLPGGDIPNGNVEAYIEAAQRRWPFLPADVVRRLVRAYGTRIESILADAKSADDLGQDFGRGLTEAELHYLVDQEWACTAEDVLWRRSKLGLHLPPDTATELSDWFNSIKNNSSPRSGQHD